MSWYKLSRSGNWRALFIRKRWSNWELLFKWQSWGERCHDFEIFVCRGQAVSGLPDGEIWGYGEILVATNSALETMDFIDPSVSSAACLALIYSGRTAFFADDVCTGNEHAQEVSTNVENCGRRWKFIMEEITVWCEGQGGGSGGDRITENGRKWFHEEQVEEARQRQVFYSDMVMLLI